MLVCQSINAVARLYNKNDALPCYPLTVKSTTENHPQTNTTEKFNT